jgi:preprotein translocase subunit YajC
VDQLLTHLMTLQNAPEQPSCAGALAPFFIMIIIFYMILIRPQQKQERERQEMLSRLKSGDLVITSGGIIGMITSVSDTEVKIEVGEKNKVKIRVARDDVDLYGN